MLTLTAFIATIAKFVRSKTDNTMQQRYSITFDSKDMMNTVETYDYVNDSTQSRPESSTDEMSGENRRDVGKTFL